MRTLTANEAKTQFGQFIDMAQREPVRVMRRDRVVGVLVSAEDYEAMRQFYANRLAHTLAASSAQAAPMPRLPPVMRTTLLMLLLLQSNPDPRRGTNRYRPAAQVASIASERQG